MNLVIFVRRSWQFVIFRRIFGYWPKRSEEEMTMKILDKRCKDLKWLKAYERIDPNFSYFVNYRLNSWRWWRDYQTAKAVAAVFYEIPESLE